MKTKITIFFTGILSAFLISSCGPAAEDREAMYARAKVFQDSIANIIKTSMDDAALSAKMNAQAVAQQPQPTDSIAAKPQQ